MMARSVLSTRKNHVPKVIEIKVARLPGEAIDTIDEIECIDDDQDGKHGQGR
jgi:hypothetical protein